MNIVLWVLQVLLAMAFLAHMRGELSSAVTTAFLVVVTFVAYMRWKAMPILPRTHR